MADTKISDETAASTLTGAELLLGVQGGANVKITADQLAARALAANRDIDGTLAANSDNKLPTQKAVKTYVDAAVAGLVDASPGTLDTLNELAAALGDDANFASTMATALAAKAPLASPALTGTPTAPTAAGGTSTTQVATTAFVQTALSPSVTVETFSAAPTIDVSGKPAHATFRMTLTANVTALNFTGAADGQKFTLELIQDGMGSRTVALGSSVAFGTDIASFTATTTASKTDVLGFVYNSAAAKYRLVAVAKGY